MGLGIDRYIYICIYRHTCVNMFMYVHIHINIYTFMILSGWYYDDD